MLISIEILLIQFTPKIMKFILSLFLTFSVLCTSLSGVEYGTLHYNPIYGALPSSEYKVTLAEGDYFEVLSWYSNLISGRVQIILKNENFPYSSNWGIEGNLLAITDPSYGTPIINSIIGPCEIFINLITGDDTNKTAFINFKLTRASEVEYKNVNIISLPSSTVGQGTHEIVVEASDDLQTWTPVHSSSIGGSKAFFRTRVVEAGE